MKDEDVETIIRWLEKRRDELKESIKETFVSLKNRLKMNDWDVAMVDCETLVETLSELNAIELTLDKIKVVIEE